MSGCIFCDIVAGNISTDKVLDSDYFIVIKDISPKVKNHLLVIPKKHYETFLDMPPDLYEGLLSITKEAIEKLKVDNFNLILNNGKIAGQLIPHVHLHVLPRKNDDGFRVFA